MFSGRPWSVRGLKDSTAVATSVSSSVGRLERPTSRDEAYNEPDDGCVRSIDDDDDEVEVKALLKLELEGASRHKVTRPARIMVFLFVVGGSSFLIGSQVQIHLGRAISE